MSEVTRILKSIDAGDQQAAEALLPLVYDELRKLAANKMANEGFEQTLQPTALVHEAWLRLSGDSERKWDSRNHFFAAAAEAMRRILIESARRKKALKRGGRLERLDLDLDSIHVATHSEPDELLAMSEALNKLAREDSASAELIKLRFFLGMTNREAAEAMGISERSAKRYWAFARAFLFQELRHPTEGDAEMPTPELPK